MGHNRVAENIFVVYMRLMKKEMHRALKRALKRAGSMAALAKINNTTPQRVRYWVEHGKRLPAECVFATEDATGVSRWDLRPDIYIKDGIRL